MKKSSPTRLLSTGFAVSFAGALPPGVVALGVLQASLAGGWWGGWLFSLGSLSVEAVVVWWSLVGLAWLTRHRKFLKILDWATLLLLTVLAIGMGWQVFQPSPAAPISAADRAVLLPASLPFFAAGGLLRLLTPTLLPFWMACNGVLFSKNVLSSEDGRRRLAVYVGGVAVGTFAAHSIFVAASLFAQKFLSDLQFFVNWLIFIGLAAAAVGQFVRLTR